MINKLIVLLKKMNCLCKYIILLILRSPVDAVLCIISACFLNSAFQALENGDFTSLANACMEFAFANFLVFMYNGTVWSVNAGFSARFSGKLKWMMFDYMMNQSLQEMEQKQGSQWMLRINDDSRMTAGLLNDSFNIPHFVLAAVRIITSLVLFGSISYVLLLLDLTMLLPYQLFYYKCVVKPAQSITEKAQRLKEKNLSYTTTILNCTETIYLYEAEEFVYRRYERSSMELAKERIRFAFRKATTDMVIPLIGRGGYFLLFTVGCIMIQKNMMQFGELLAALQYRGALLMATNLLQNCMVQIAKNAVGMERISI